MNVYARALRYRWPIIAFIFLTVMIVSTLFAVYRPVTYTASAQLFVSTVAEGEDSVDLNQSGQFAQQRVKSYVELVNTPRVLDPVIQEMALGTNADDFARKVSASAPLGTVLIDVAVTDADPTLATRAANLIAKQFSRIAPKLEAPRSGTTAPIAVAVSRPATLPSSPDGVSARTVVVLGAFVGLALGLGCAVLQDTFLSKLFDRKTAARRLQVPVLAEIKSPREQGRSSVEEELEKVMTYGFLRAAIFSFDKIPSQQSVLVTSVASELSTADVSVGLAASFAASGARVLVVEGSPNQQDLMRLLGVPRSHMGLVEALLSVSPVCDLVVPTGISNVELLCFESEGGSSFELPVGGQVSTMLDELVEMVDVVIVNGPAIADGASSLVWTASTARTLLCVPAGVRETDAVHALRMLEAVRAGVSGLVIKGRARGANTVEWPE